MFIVIELCDNDFGSQLEQAARIVYDQYGTSKDAEVFRRGVVAVASALADLRHPGSTSFHYLHTSVRVTYETDAPSKDHDGGSVCINTYTNYIWRF